MNFSHALDALKDGKRVQRAGWNGKGMFIFQGLPRVEINTKAETGYITSRDAADVFGINYDGPILCMKTAQNTIVAGWLASQTDLLADDWEAI